MSSIFCISWSKERLSTERLAKALSPIPPDFRTGVPKSSSFSYQVITSPPDPSCHHVAAQTRAQEYGQHAAAAAGVPAHGLQREELSHFMEQVGDTIISTPHYLYNIYTHNLYMIRNIYTLSTNTLSIHYLYCRCGDTCRTARPAAATCTARGSGWSRSTGPCSNISRSVRIRMKWKWIHSFIYLIVEIMFVIVWPNGRGDLRCSWKRVVSINIFGFVTMRYCLIIFITFKRIFDSVL